MSFQMNLYHMIFAHKNSQIQAFCNCLEENCVINQPPNQTSTQVAQFDVSGPQLCCGKCLILRHLT